MSDRPALDQSAASDPLRAIFTDVVMERLAAAPQTQSLKWRRLVLTASGPMPSDRWDAEMVMRARGQKAAWDVYLDAAFACGLFDEPYARDLVERLTHVDDAQFRSGMAECLAAWYFMGKLRLPTSARPTGNNERPLELLVKLPDGDVHVEVKSPLREPIVDGRGHWFDDSDILESCLARASSQFRKDARNLLFLTGRLTLPIMSQRRFLSKAFYADQALVFHINRETGDPVGKGRVEYLPTGRFLKQWGEEEGPRHTRVGGVLFVEENLREYRSPFGRDWRVLAFHDALMMHNPNALLPLPEEPWGDCPQMVSRGDAIEWTDGHSV
jgi:hypothetical protein